MRRFLLVLLTVVLLSSVSLAGAVTFKNVNEKPITLENPKPEKIIKGRIYGKVKSFSLQQGIQPVEGATVHCIGVYINITFLPFDITFEEFEDTNITDQNGSYNLEIPVLGFYLVYPEKEGYIPSPILGFASVYEGLRDKNDRPIWPALFMIPITI